MEIDKQQIEHLANLARLDITDKDKEKFTEQISSILAYFDQLNELDTTNVEPLAHVFDLNNVLRDDEPKQIYSQDKVLAEAPEIEKRQIKVKVVLRDTTDNR